MIFRYCASQISIFRKTFPSTRKKFFQVTPKTSFIACRRKAFSRKLFSLQITSQVRNYAASANPKPQALDELRKTINSFLLKVHPDFFTEQPEIRSMNERSLKLLNTFLDIVDNHVKEEEYFQLDSNSVPTHIKIEFYYRSENEIKPIKASYTFPKAFFEKKHHVNYLEREAFVFFSFLVRQAGISPPSLPFHLQTVGSEDMVSPSQPKTPRRKRGATGITDALRMELEYTDKTSIQWLKYHSVDEVPETISETALDESIIFFAPSLDSAKQAHGLYRFKKDLAYLSWKPQYEIIPILFTNGGYLKPSVLPGFLSIPYNYKFDKLKQYFDANIDSILEKRRSIQMDMIDVQFYIVSLSEHFKLRGIYINKNHRDVDFLNVLKILNFNKDAVPEKKYFEGLTWIVGGKDYSFDWSNGIIYLASDFEMEQFLFFLNSNVSLLACCWSLNGIPGSVTNEMYMVLNCFAILLGAKSVLFDVILLKNKIWQTIAVSNLETHLESLKKCKFDSFVILLSDHFELDLEKQILYLPYKFEWDHFASFLKEKVKVLDDKANVAK